MELFFEKYHGTANDFILIDNRKNTFNNRDTKLVKYLCDRRIGIGGDGLILLEKDTKHDFFMRYYNSDGNESTMCGNGGRCIVAFAHNLGLFEQETTFSAPDGVHTAKITYKGIALAMNDVENVERIGKDYYLNTGSPHYVKIIENHTNWDTVSEGIKIRYSKRFQKEGTNVNFLSLEQGQLQVSTYERGVEDETYSCGTGTVASAIVAGIITGKNKHSLLTKGGKLHVSYITDGSAFRNIVLEGPAVKVFEGVFKKT